MNSQTYIINDTAFTDYNSVDVNNIYLFIDNTAQTQNSTIQADQTLNTNNEIVLIDASLNTVTATLPPLGSGCKKTLVGYDSTNVITLNTDGTEEIRLHKNNVSTTDNLVEGDVLKIVDVGTHWQII